VKLAKGSRIAQGAFAAGAAAAALVLAGWTVPGGKERPGARISVEASRSPDLAIEPVAGAAAAKNMRPSVSKRGLARTFTVWNATGGTVTVRVRARPETKDLDRVLALRLRVREATIFEGSLAELRRGRTRPFRLASHKGTRISVKAWIPASVREGYHARVETVGLEFMTRKAP
jgi:hypothetical protein